MDDEEEEEEESVQFDILSIETVSPPVDVSTADGESSSADLAAAAAVVVSRNSSRFNLEANQKHALKKQRHQHLHHHHQQRQQIDSLPRRLPFISPCSASANDTLAPNRRHARSHCERNTADADSNQNTGPKSSGRSKKLSSSSKSSSTNKKPDNECTCLKHCARRPPSPMEECPEETECKTKQQDQKETEELDEDEEEDEEEDDEFSSSTSERPRRQSTPVNSDQCKVTTATTTTSSTTTNQQPPPTKEQPDNNNSKEVLDLAVNITLKRRTKDKVGNSPLKSGKTTSEDDDGPKRCVPSLISKMFSLLRADTWTGKGNTGAKRVLFPLILILSITALVLLHNG